MENSLYAAIFVLFLLVYIPGFFLSRALRISRILSVICAPLFTIPLYIILTIIYSKIGIFCNWAVLVIPLLVAALFAYAASLFFVKKKGLPSLDFPLLLADKHPLFSDWANLGLYVACGCIVAACVYLGSLNGAESFIQEYDNVHHLGETCGFVTSGDWSPFIAPLYATEQADRINPLPGAGFYPSAWSCLSALLVSMLGVSSSLAANAVNFLFIAIVFPANVFALMRMIFRHKPDIVPLGALIGVAFTAFPWGFLLFGPLYPNVLAFAVFPLVAFCFMDIFEEGFSRKARILAGMLFCFGIAALAFLHPNAVFTMAVFLAPYCVWQVIKMVDYLKVSDKKRKTYKIIGATGMVIFIMLVWVMLYKVPFLRNVVSHNWPACQSVFQAFVSVLSLSFNFPGAQVVLAAFVLAGIVYTLLHRQYLWISCAYAIMIFFYIIDTASDFSVKFLLTGFWYTDSWRIAASATIFAIPLAMLGFWLAIRALSYLLCRINVFPKHRVSLVATGVVVVVFILTNFFPGINISRWEEDTPTFRHIYSYLEEENRLTAPQVYDQDEVAFVKKVKSIVPEGALILNEPDDGSAFAYGVDTLNVYYRYLRTYGEDDETEDSKLIRNHLSEIATRTDVQDAVKNVGGEYLLLLDQGEAQNERRYLFTYDNGKNWQGIEAVNDETRGFEAVLSCGDMRLYRITADS